MTDHGGAASPRTALPDGLRRDLIRAIAGLDGYANPNTARGDYWDKRLALVFEVVQPYLPPELDADRLAQASALYWGAEPDRPLPQNEEWAEGVAAIYARLSGEATR